MELYLDLHSQPCRSVYLLAKKTGIPFQFKAVDLSAARVNEFLSWQHTALRAHGSKVFWFRAVIPVITGAAVPKEKMDSALEDLMGTLEMFQNKFLKDGSFIAGEEVIMNVDGLAKYFQDNGMLEFLKPRLLKMFN
ncbi:hypothetical protein CRUP_020309 [Coryphaenoides rupestris]|nr:hypothetical protein CRUP_020309 [Coryphaenoides rupestris]